MQLVLKTKDIENAYILNARPDLHFEKEYGNSRKDLFWGELCEAKENRTFRLNNVVNGPIKLSKVYWGRKSRAR